MRPVLRRVPPRLLAVAGLLAAVFGLLAAGALGTSKSGLSGAAPQLSAASAVAHDTSVPLTQAPNVPLDPNRVIPEFERQTPAGVNVSPHDPVLQTGAVAPAIAATATTFPGVRQSQLSVGWYPPDTVGDIGMTQYVQAVNGAIDVFSKTGDNLTGVITDDSFWSGFSPCDNLARSDPTVNYDEYANRWVYSEVTTDTTDDYYECVAVSTSDDATGSWYRYAFDLGSTYFPDYPKLGVWPDGYYLSFNDFTGGSSYRGVGALALERSAMLTGSNAQMVFFDLAGVQTLPFGMLPSDADGSTPPPANAPNYFTVANDDPSLANNDQLGVWAFHVDWSAPGGSTFTNVQNLNVAAFDGIGLDVPQPGGGTPQLDPLAYDQLMNRVQYRNFGGYETLVAYETVNNSGSDEPRWYELRRVAGTWSVNQQSTFAQDATYRWMGSVAMNGLGDMALGYSAGDGATDPGLRFTGRLSGDALDTMQAENVFQAGGGVQTGATRWGDYSQMTVDPSDDCTFWYTGEYYTSTGATSWATRIGSIRIGTCTGPTGPTYSVVPVISGSTTEGQTLSTTAGTWSPAPTGTSYQWRRCDSNSLTCVDIASATASTYTLQAADAGNRIRVKVTVTAATGTSSVVSASTAAITPLPPVNSSVPTITGTAQLGQTLVAAHGAWTSSVTPVYGYQWQRCAPGCADIPGANQSTYVLTNSGDVGATILVKVTATNAGGNATASSAQTAAVQQPPSPVNTVLPTVTGVAMVGNLLGVTTGTWIGVAPIIYTYQWQTCTSLGTNCVNMGVTATSYTPVAGDIGTRLRVVVTGTNSGGGNSVNTAVTSAIVPRPPVNTVPPAISGIAQVGQTMSVTQGTWTGTGPISYTYAWQTCSSGGANCTTIAGATGSSYTLQSSDQTLTVRALVKATNGGGTTTANSAVSSVVAAGSIVSGGGGSGGGGGTGGSLDLALTGYQLPAHPLPGETVTYALIGQDLTTNQLAQNVHVRVTLPAGVSYQSSTADRGSGCTLSGTSSLDCYLDFLSGQAPVGNILIYAKVDAAGTHTLTATISAQQAESSLANNILSLSDGTTTTGGVPVGLNGDGTTSTTTDKTRPTAYALSSAVRRGRVAKLMFKIYDNSGVAKATATVRRGNKTVAHVKTGFGPVAYGTKYFVGWKVPMTAAKGGYIFCVTALDKASNVSAQSCAPLTVR